MAAQAPARVSVLRLVLVIFLSRIVLNVGYRAVYPFLPFIAADLGVSFQSAASIIQSRNLIGLAAPLFGPLSDHLGRRTVMFASLLVAVAACLALGLTDSFWLAVAVIAVVSLSKAVFDPAQQAYMGDRVPYVERGRAISLSEVSWSAAALIGLPLFGIAVQYAGWRAGFVILGLVGLVMMFLVRFGLPGGDRAEHHTAGGFWDRTFGQIVRHPLALAILLAAAANAATNENVNVVFGEWLEGQFSLGAIALGTVASAIGVAELGGELVSSGWADRIGKHRLVQFTLLLSAGAYALLPFIGRSAVLAAGGLVLAFFFFEITVVAAIPLVTEVLPSARATLLSLNVAAFALGRLIGSITGPALFSMGGILWNGLASAGAALVTFLIWSAFVREQGV